MSIIHWDSFAHYRATDGVVSAADMAGRWDQATGNGYLTVLGDGRCGMAMDHWSTGIRTTVAAGSTFVFHFTLHNFTGADNRLVVLHNGGTHAGQIAFHAGHLEYNTHTWGSEGQNVVLQTEAFIPWGTSVHVGCKVVLSSTATGSVTFWINGVQDSTVSNVVTGANGQSQATIVGLGRDEDYSPNFSISDWVLDDADYLGVQAASYAPGDGAGDASDWTPSAGSNWQNIDEIDHDGDTTYNESSTSTDEDAYTIAEPAAAYSSIEAVCPFAVARKTDGGGGAIKVGVREGDPTTTLAQSASLSLTESYQIYSDIFTTNPDTAAAWQDSELATTQASVENST